MGERWAKDECMVGGEWYYYVVRSSLKRRQSGQRSRGRSRELESISLVLCCQDKINYLGSQKQWIEIISIVHSNAMGTTQPPDRKSSPWRFLNIPRLGSIRTPVSPS